MCVVCGGGGGGGQVLVGSIGSGSSGSSASSGCVVQAVSLGYQSVGGMGMYLLYAVLAVGVQQFSCARISVQYGRSSTVFCPRTRTPFYPPPSSSSSSLYPSSPIPSLVPNPPLSSLLSSLLSPPLLPLPPPSNHHPIVKPNTLHLIQPSPS